MNILEDMNRALDYVESTLQEKTNYEKIAQTACCSVFHFQRMFTMISNLTLSEYIRRRKMTLAAFELQNSDIKIIDLALKYGYESPEAFTRAFQSLHGLTPSAARSAGVSIKAFPRISFQLTVKGVIEMNYRIVEKDAFQVYGMERIFDYDGNFHGIADFWKEKVGNGECEALVKSSGHSGCDNSVCGYEKLSGDKYTYMLCVEKAADSNTQGYKVVEVPKASWAIFVDEPHSIEETSKAIQDTVARAYTEWLPTSSYELVEGYEFEMYYEKDGKYYEEVWIRVVPKGCK